MLIIKQKVGFNSEYERDTFLGNPLWKDCMENMAHAQDTLKAKQKAGKNK